MAFRGAIVYINGKYIGIEDLREDLSNDYVAEHYSIPKDQIAIMNNDIELNFIPKSPLPRLPRDIRFYYILDTANTAYDSDYRAMIAFIATNDMTNDELYKQAGLKLDLNNFMKYMAFEMYSGNTDWPHNNLRAWRYTGDINSNLGQDGKWRYMLKDLDFAFARYTTHDNNAPELYCDYDRDPFKNVFQNYYNDPLTICAMLKSLLKNTTFKQSFKDYMNNDLLNNIVSPTNAKSVLEFIKNEIKGEIPYHFQKWDINNNNWESRLGNITNFMDKRPEAIRNFMAQSNELK